MSEFDEYDDNDFNDDQDQDQGRNNNPVNALRKQNKELNKQLKAIQEQFETLSKEKKARDLSVALDAAGVKDARAAKLISAAGVDPSDETAVKTWLGEYGDLFGITDKEKSEEADNTATNLSRQSAFQAGGSAGGDAQAALNQLSQAKSPDELRAILAAHNVRM